MKRIKILNKLSWKASLYNYSATGIGLLLYTICAYCLFQYLIHNAEKLGILFPVVMIFVLQLCIKGLFLIPRPVSTYETIQIDEED